MESNTFVRAEIWTVAQTDQGNVVLIRPIESDIVVPIFVSNLETQSILIGLGNLALPRPLTHDLMLSLMKNLEVNLVRIEIYELLDNIYYSRIILDNEGNEIRLESRPSDAIALSVRCKTDVFISEEIIEKTGIPMESLRDVGTNEESFLTKSDKNHENVCWEDLFQKDEQKESSPIEKKETTPPTERELLNIELEKAIEIEDYERAAVIRDKLKEL